MKLSLSGRIVETSQGSAMPIGAFIRMAKETGYSCLDLRYSQIGPDYSDGLLKEVEAALRETGLAVAILNAGGINDDKGLEGLWRISEAARRLDCGLIRVSGPVAMMQKASDAVRPLGLRLCTQIHTGGDYETIASTKETLGKIGRANFGVLVEPANLLMARQPYGKEALALIVRSIFGVNLQSITVVEPSAGGNELKLRDGTKVYYARVPLAENTQLDLRGCFGGLRAVGFDGFINVLEPFDAKLDSAAVARNTAETLQGLLAKRN